MKRGYIRPSIRHSEHGQRAILMQAGVEVIYVEGQFENIREYIASLRDGDDASVVTLARLGPNRQMLRTYIGQIHDKGCVIVEEKTGRRLDTSEAMAIAVLDAVDELAQDRRAHAPDDARRYGKLGGRPKKEKMSKPAAEKIWFDTRIKSVAEAMARMEGWSTRMAYREFGPRGVSVGRPPKT